TRRGKGRLPGSRGPLRIDRHLLVDRRHLRVPVEERRRTRPVPDVRRVDLELHVEDEGLVLRDVAERELELPVVARLTGGARLEGVDGHALGPARAETEDRVLQLLVGRDVEAGLPDQAASKLGRRVDAQGRGGHAGLRRGRTLAENVEEGKQRDKSDQREEQAADPEILVASAQVAIALKVDLLRRRHVPRFATTLARPARVTLSVQGRKLTKD